jgi:hypothetical protein
MKITKDMMINFIKQQAKNVYYDTEGNLSEEAIIEIVTDEYEGLNPEISGEEWDKLVRETIENYDYYSEANRKFREVEDSLRDYNQDYLDLVRG